MAERARRKPGASPKPVSLDERYKHLAQTYRDAHIADWHERAWAKTYGRGPLDQNGLPRQQAVSAKRAKRR